MRHDFRHNMVIVHLAALQISRLAASVQDAAVHGLGFTKSLSPLVCLQSRATYSPSPQTYNLYSKADSSHATGALDHSASSEPNMPFCMSFVTKLLAHKSTVHNYKLKTRSYGLKPCGYGVGGAQVSKQS